MSICAVTRLSNNLCFSKIKCLILNAFSQKENCKSSETQE